MVSAFSLSKHLYKKPGNNVDKCLELKQGGASWIILTPGVTGHYAMVTFYVDLPCVRRSCKNEPGIQLIPWSGHSFSLIVLTFSSQFLCI